MKLDRLLSIVLLLLNRPMITARELSEKYEVSIRTIYRDARSQKFDQVIPESMTAINITKSSSN